MAFLFRLFSIVSTLFIFAVTSSPVFSSKPAGKITLNEVGGSDDGPVDTNPDPPTKEPPPKPHGK